MRSALEGIHVLDLSRHAPGPYCTMILGDLGADIIKVEGKSSDFVVPEFPFPGSPFDSLNRNKRSIVLDLKAEEGRRIFYELIKEADVVVEGFRPGVAKRLGLDYGSLNKINPRLVYCAITGYGQEGPYSNLVGHDLTYLAQGGLLSIVKRTDTIPGTVIGDMASGGMQAAIGILAALVSRQGTGRGQFVDIAMVDGVVSLISLYVAKYLETGCMPGDDERSSISESPYYHVYETKDRKFLAIASLEPQFFARLCEVLGCKEVIPYQRDPGRASEIKGLFSRIFLTRTRDEWFDILTRGDTPVGKVQTIEEVVRDPQVRCRQMITELDHPVEGKVRQVGVAVKLSETPGSIRRFSPRRGEHTVELLTQLGYSKESIQELLDSGVAAAS